MFYSLFCQCIQAETEVKQQPSVKPKSEGFQCIQAETEVKQQPLKRLIDCFL